MEHLIDKDEVFIITVKDHNEVVRLEMVTDTIVMAAIDKADTDSNNKHGHIKGLHSHATNNFYIALMASLLANEFSHHYQDINRILRETLYQLSNNERYIEANAYISAIKNLASLADQVDQEAQRGKH